MGSSETGKLVPAGKEHPHVLLVDDDVVFGKILQRVAEVERIPLTYVSSLEGLEELADLPFDVGIFDYDLGSITGLQLTSFLQRYVRKFPVVLISQYRHIENRGWPDVVKNFITKSRGAHDILKAAIDVHDQTKIEPLQ